MIILGRNEDVAIERADLGGPRFGVGLTVLPHDGRHRLVEERQVVIFDVHEFEPGVGALFRDFVDPFGDGLAVAAGPRASEDDGNSKHSFLLFGFDVFSLCLLMKVLLIGFCSGKTSCSPLIRKPPRSSTTVVRIVGTPNSLAVLARPMTLFTTIVGSWLCRLANWNG